MASNPNRDGKDVKSKYKITERGKGNTLQIGTHNVMISGLGDPGNSDSRPTVNIPPDQQDPSDFEVTIEGEDCRTQVGPYNISYQNPRATTKPQQAQQHTREDLKRPFQESEQKTKGATTKPQQAQQHTREDLKRPFQESEQKTKGEDEMIHCQAEEQSEETFHKEPSSNRDEELRETTTTKNYPNSLNDEIDEEESILGSCDERSEFSCSDEEYPTTYNQLSSKPKPEAQGTLNETEGSLSIGLNTSERNKYPPQIPADTRDTNSSNQSTSTSGHTETPREAGAEALKTLGTNATTEQPIVFRQIQGNYVFQQRHPVVDISAENKILQAQSDSQDDPQEVIKLTVTWTGLDKTFAYKTVWQVTGVSKEMALTNLLRDVMQNLQRLISVLFERYQAQVLEVQTEEDILLIVRHTDEQSAMNSLHSKEDICNVLQPLMNDKDHPGRLKLDISFPDDQSSGRHVAMSGQQNSDQQDVRPKQFNRPVDKSQDVKDEAGTIKEKKAVTSPISNTPHWEYQDNDGSWIKYEQSQSEKLEKEYSSPRRSRTSLITRESKGFRVDFSAMLETNLEERGQPKRDVRRVGGEMNE